MRIGPFVLNPVHVVEQNFRRFDLLSELPAELRQTVFKHFSYDTERLARGVDKKWAQNVDAYRLPLWAKKQSIDPRALKQHAQQLGILPFSVAALRSFTYEQTFDSRSLTSTHPAPI